MVCLECVFQSVSPYVVTTRYPYGDIDLAHFLITNFGSYDDATVVYCYFVSVLFEKVLQSARDLGPGQDLPKKWRDYMNVDVKNGAKRQSLYKEVVKATEQVLRYSLL